MHFIFAMNVRNNYDFIMRRRLATEGMQEPKFVLCPCPLPTKNPSPQRNRDWCYVPCMVLRPSHKDVSSCTALRSSVRLSVCLSV